jgi:hypothetical protein
MAGLISTTVDEMTRSIEWPDNLLRSQERTGGSADPVRTDAIEPETAVLDRIAEPLCRNIEPDPGLPLAGHVQNS